MATTTETKRMCAGVDCTNEAGALQCPTCLKLDLKDSYFCSQDCFKKSWVRLNLALSYALLIYLPYLNIS